MLDIPFKKLIHQNPKIKNVLYSLLENLNGESTIV